MDVITAWDSRKGRKLIFQHWGIHQLAMVQEAYVVLSVRNDRNRMNCQFCRGRFLESVWAGWHPSEYPSAERNVAVREENKEKMEAAKAVKKAAILKKIMPWSSHLHFFTIEKFPTGGKHNKYKILLASHGYRQDAQIDPFQQNNCYQLGYRSL